MNGPNPAYKAPPAPQPAYPQPQYPAPQPAYPQPVPQPAPVAQQTTPQYQPSYSSPNQPAPKSNKRTLYIAGVVVVVLIVFVALIFLMGTKSTYVCDQDKDPECMDEALEMVKACEDKRILFEKHSEESGIKADLVVSYDLSKSGDTCTIFQKVERADIDVSELEDENPMMASLAKGMGKMIEDLEGKSRTCKVPMEKLESIYSLSGISSSYCEGELSGTIGLT